MTEGQAVTRARKRAKELQEYVWVVSEPDEFVPFKHNYFTAVEEDFGTFFDDNQVRFAVCPDGRVWR